MAIIKCKMCGGDLDIIEGASTAECEYCGSRQTVPKVDDEKKLNLFARANRFRSGCDFDKASGVYESIIADFPEEAEAYWGLVLCKYGIEYVDDPATGKKVPTCHRSSFESVLDDVDLVQALEKADGAAQSVYRQEANQIEELRKGIISVSVNEQPYDIFICYKETDSAGQRTLDSVMAQDLYDLLTAKKYRVFFARITLEDKLGVEYEPYIFAALNSARIMLVVGTNHDYFDAVWVKNEWSRYLKLMAADKSRHLIPCYKGIDAYDLPKEFAKLQAQDLGKVGAEQDLLRGIEKLLPKQVAMERVVVQSGTAPDANSLLRRGELFLGDGDWNNAIIYFDKVLDIQPECAEAYRGKLLANFQARNIDDLRRMKKPFGADPNYQKAIAFGSDALRNSLKETLTVVANAAREEERVRKEEEERKRQEAEARKRQQEEQRAKELAIRQAQQERQREFLQFNRTLAIAIGAINLILLILGMIFKNVANTQGYAVRGLFSLGMMNFNSLITVGACVMTLIFKATEKPLEKKFNLITIGSGGLIVAILALTMVIGIVRVCGAFRYEFWGTLWIMICLILSYSISMVRVALTAVGPYLGKKPGDDLLLLGKDPKKIRQHKMITKLENSKAFQSIKKLIDKA